MKLKDFQKTDQTIIKALKSHIGIDKAIKLNTLAQQLNLTERRCSLASLFSLLENRKVSI